MHVMFFDFLKLFLITHFFVFLTFYSLLSFDYFVLKGEEEGSWFANAWKVFVKTVKNVWKERFSSDEQGEDREQSGIESWEWEQNGARGRSWSWAGDFGNWTSWKWAMMENPGTLNICS